MVQSVTSKMPQLVVLSQKSAPDIAGLRSNDAQATTKPATAHISLASALAQKGPPFDAERIASLKEAIASGTYRIDLGAIADGVIRFGLHDPA